MKRGHYEFVRLQRSSPLLLPATSAKKKKRFDNIARPYGLCAVRAKLSKFHDKEEYLRKRLSKLAAYASKYE